MRNNKGITLIALVITIIVLLILAGVSIAMLTGDNGILTQATSARDDTKNAELADKINMALNGELANLLADGYLSGGSSTSFSGGADAIAKANGISTTDFDIVLGTSKTDATSLKITAKGTSISGSITYDADEGYKVVKANYLGESNTTNNT